MIQVLGVLQFATSLLVCMFFYLNYGSLIATKNLKRWMTKSKKPGGRPTVAGGSSDDDGEHDEFTFAFAKKATPAGDLALAEAKLVDSKSEQTLSMAEILDLVRRFALLLLSLVPTSHGSAVACGVRLNRIAGRLDHVPHGVAQCNGAG